MINCSQVKSSSKCQEDAENLDMSYTMNSPSDEITVTGDEDSDFTVVKNNNFPKRVKNEWTIIDTFNIFELFDNPEFQDPVTNDQDSLFETKVPEMQASEG